MSGVTHRPMCYVYVCAGCNLLSCSDRRDQVTCSTRCRVRAHRNGSLRTLRASAARWEITAAGILQAKALDLLRPDLAAQVLAGSMTMEVTRPEVWSAFWSLAMKEAAA